VVFSIQVAWRLAYPRYDEAGRVAFMTTLANRTGEELAENRARLLGDRDAAPSGGFHRPAQPRNASTPSSATARTAPTSPSCATSRRPCRAHAGEGQALDLDQVMAIEAREAAAMIAKSVAGLFGEAPRRARRPVQSEG